MGRFLDFKTVYGRYQGIPGQIGFDGHWISPQGFHIVVEVKTSEVYPIRAATLVNYVDELISAKQIANWDVALGLYVIGRPDPEIQQLQNAILAEKRTHQLRIISIESLLSLAEITNEYDVNHEDVLAILRPSGPKIDPLIDLMARLAAVSKTIREARGDYVALTGDSASKGEEQIEEQDETKPSFWLTPVKSDDVASAESTIETLVGQEHVYGFGERTPGRRHLRPGDKMCFYATGVGVIAHATITTLPKKQAHPKIRHPDQYPWTFRLKNVGLYLSDPTVIDAQLRAQLDAFTGKDPNTSYWAWFVQATRRLTEHDFDLLTRQGQSR